MSIERSNLTIIDRNGTFSDIVSKALGLPLNSPEPEDPNACEVCHDIKHWATVNIGDVYHNANGTARLGEHRVINTTVFSLLVAQTRYPTFGQDGQAEEVYFSLLLVCVDEAKAKYKRIGLLEHDFAFSADKATVTLLRSSAIW